MIIKIHQTASNIKQTYSIDGENFHFIGNSGSICQFQPITISNKESTIKGVFCLANWVNYIPLRHLFNIENLRKSFHIFKNDNKYGKIMFSKHGFLKRYYMISLDNGETYYCYYYSKGSFDYVSIYKGDTQIALIETYLNNNDLKFTHKLYLLDEYNYLAETLSFFVIYYANFSFVKRFHMSKGSYYAKSWTLHKYNKMYNPKWRETYFPQENFFGKTSLL